MPKGFALPPEEKEFADATPLGLDEKGFENGFAGVERLAYLGLGLFFFDLLLLDFGSGSLTARAFCDAHSTNAPHATLLSSAWFAPTCPDVESPFVTRELVRKVAVEFEEEAEIAITDFALC